MIRHLTHLTHLTGGQKGAYRILDAFTMVGFIYLSNALALETIEKAFSLSKECFAESLEEKSKVEWKSFGGKRGFVVKGISAQIIPFDNRTRANFQS